MNEVTREDVREVLAYKRTLIPRELHDYHHAWHDVTGLHARYDQGRVPDDVETSSAWRSLGEGLGRAERELVDTVREEYPDLIAEYDPDDYR